MPSRPDLPCAHCGKLMWRGSTSLPAGAAMCQPCRRSTNSWMPSNLPASLRTRTLGECERDGCSRAAVARNMCGTHYAYWYRREVSGEWRAGGWISRERRLALYERDGWVCALCSEPVDRDADAKRSDWAPSLDHILPRSLGGGDEDSNLRCAHRGCNARRGARVEEVA